VSLDTYLTLQEATQRYKLDPQLLTRLVRDGRIRGGRFDGTFVLLEKDTRQVAEQQATKEDLRKRVAHLEGQAISINGAARKYGLHPPNISRWTKAGYIRVLSPAKGRGHKLLIDESDIAYAKELANAQQMTRGKTIFTPEYIPDWF